MKRLLFIANASSVALVLFVNYFSQTGGINNQTVGGLSDRYDNLFTPAGYAFAIWGIIFLGMILFVVYHGISLTQKENSSNSFSDIGFRFAWVNLGNASWVVAWLYEFTLVSVFIMVGMLIGLGSIIQRVSITKTSITDRILAKWPMTIYAGWISVATIANIAAYLSKLNWTGGIFAEETWAMIMMLAAVFVNAFVLWTQSTKAFVLVGIWALYAIYIRHQGSYQDVALVALVGVGLLALNIVAKIVYDYRISLKSI